MKEYSVEYLASFEIISNEKFYKYQRIKSIILLLNLIKFLIVRGFKLIIRKYVLLSVCLIPTCSEYLGFFRILLEGIVRCILYNKYYYFSERGVQGFFIDQNYEKNCIHSLLFI